MPDTKWNIIAKRPINTLKILLRGSWHTTLILLARIIFPFRARKLSLKVSLLRAWVIAAHDTDPEVFLSEPWRHRCQEVRFEMHEANGIKQHGSTAGAPVEEVGGWIVPSTNVDELKDKDAIILFAHGGGYALGHGLQNLTDFNRWVKKAKMFGQNWAVASVKYREYNLNCRAGSSN
jgi:acetyl esterase/lipase